MHAVLERAAVADVRLGAVAHEPELVVDLVRPEVLTLGAAPVVVVLVVGEAGGPVAQRAPVRVGGQPLEDERPEDQRRRVDRGQDDFGPHAMRAAVASSAPAP